MVAGVSAAKDNSQGVAGIAPGARLWAVKVLDRNGEGFDSDIIKGIDYVTDHKNEIDSVNLSFGGDGPDDALHSAISNSVAAGITYAVAAGNEATDAKSTVPASFPEVIAVSAIADSDGKCGSQGPSTSYGSDDTLASFSNYGSVIDLAAPGVDIQTTYKGSSYRSFSGTSASTPFVTGAAALYKSTHSGATPADIRNALASSGSNPSTVCDGKGHGYFKGDHDSTHEPLLYLGSSTSVDTTPPTVTSTSPGGGTSNIQVNSVIKVTFSEPMLPSSVSTNTFTLRIADTTTKLGGAVSLSLDGKTATFDPSPNLATSTRYVATISTGATDLAGNALSESKKWSFSTGGVAQSDTTASTVASTNSTGGASPHPSVSSSSQSQSHSKDSPVIKNAEKETVPTSTTNHPSTTNNPPIAKDDRLRAVENRPVVGKIIDNDIAPDGNKLKIISVTSPTKNHGTVIINKNDTVTFLPATDFVGIDSFTYTVSDGDGKNDNGKVSINVIAPIEQHSQKKINSKTAITKEQLIAEGERDITENHNQIRRGIQVDNANSQEIQKRVLSNESLS
jgi:subtilase family protein/Big-like domain-containing protein